MLDILALAAACAPGVAPQTVEAVTRHESGHNPFAININGPYRLVRQPKNLPEALDTLKRVAALGYTFDVGLGQINSRNLERFGFSAEQALEPCTNLRLLQKVLVSCYASASGGPQERLGAALSCYNTGNKRSGYRNGYVARVYRAAISRSY